MKIQQLQNGEVVYEGDIEYYGHSIPQLIRNGAIKIIIEYPTSTVVIIPEKDEINITPALEVSE